MGGGQHCTEVAFALPSQPSRVRILLMVKNYSNPQKCFFCAQVGGRTWDLFFSLIFSHKQRLRPLGYCAPQVCVRPHSSSHQPSDLYKVQAPTAGMSFEETPSWSKLPGGVHQQTQTGTGLEERCFLARNKLLQRTDFKDTVVISGWRDKGGKNTHELDFLVIDSGKKCVLQIEAKSDVLSRKRKE